MLVGMKNGTAILEKILVVPFKIKNGLTKRLILHSWAFFPEKLELIFMQKLVHECS